MKRVWSFILLGGLSAAIVASLMSAAQSGPKIEDGMNAETDYTLEEMGITLIPPPDGLVPHTSASDAVVLAEKYHSDYVDADSITPVFGLFTHDQVKSDGKVEIDGVPAWIVTIQGLCEQPVGGGVGNLYGGRSTAETPADECTNTERSVVVDDSTGELIEDYSYR